MGGGEKEEEKEKGKEKEGLGLRSKVLVEFEHRPPVCSGCKVSGFQHGATTPSQYHIISSLHPPVTTPPDLVIKVGKLRKHTLSAGIRNITTGK